MVGRRNLEKQRSSSPTPLFSHKHSPVFLSTSGVAPKHNSTSAASRSVCPRFVAVLFLCLKSLLLMSIACASVALFGTKFPHILLQWYSLNKKEQLRLFVWFRLFGILFHSPCDCPPHTQSLLSVMLPGSSVVVRNLGAAFDQVVSWFLSLLSALFLFHTVCCAVCSYTWARWAAPVF